MFNAQIIMEIYENLAELIIIWILEMLFMNISFFKFKNCNFNIN